jgi:hypothetical protein
LSRQANLKGDHREPCSFQELPGHPALGRSQSVITTSALT